MIFVIFSSPSFLSPFLPLWRETLKRCHPEKEVALQVKITNRDDDEDFDGEDDEEDCNGAMEEEGENIQRLAKKILGHIGCFCLVVFFWQVHHLQNLAA